MTLLVGSIFHMTRKIVSEMTYNVSMGTLNPTIPYHTITAKLGPVCLGLVSVFLRIIESQFVYHRVTYFVFLCIICL